MKTINSTKDGLPKIKQTFTVTVHAAIFPELFETLSAAGLNWGSKRLLALAVLGLLAEKNGLAQASNSHGAKTSGPLPNNAITQVAKVDGKVFVGNGELSDETLSSIGGMFKQFEEDE